MVGDRKVESDTPRLEAHEQYLHVGVILEGLQYLSQSKNGAITNRK